jgi:hypothetical protein
MGRAKAPSCGAASLAIAAALLSCIGCTSYQVSQSSLVPAPVLPSQPNPKAFVDGYVGDATVTFLSQPRRAPSDDSGLWVTRHLIQGAVTIHASPMLGFRLIGMTGLHAGAIQAAPTSLRNPGREVGGFGHGVVATLPFGEHAFVLTADVAALSIPSFIIARCTAGCEGEPSVTSGDQRDTVLHGSSTLGYAYRVDEVLRVQLTVGMQNHPTNQEQFSSWNVNAEVHGGPLYVTAGLGLEWEPLPWLGIAPVVQWPLRRSPIEYGPIVGLGVRGMIPRRLILPPAPRL